MIYVWQTRETHRDTVEWRGKAMYRPAILCFGTTYPEILKQILREVKQHYGDVELLRPSEDTWEIKYIDVHERYNTDSQAPLWLVVRWLYDNGWKPMSKVGSDTYYFKKVEKSPAAEFRETNSS